MTLDRGGVAEFEIKKMQLNKEQLGLCLVQTNHGWLAILQALPHAVPSHTELLHRGRPGEQAGSNQLLCQLPGQLEIVKGHINKNK